MTKIKKENKAFWLRFVKNLLKRFLYGSLLQEDGWLVTKVRGKGEVQVVGGKKCEVAPRSSCVSCVNPCQSLAPKCHKTIYY